MTAPLTIAKLLSLLDAISPFSQAADWDNVGLMVGDPELEAGGILLALDPTEGLLEECQARHCDTIITHHPLIFHPLQNIRPDHPPGRLLTLALLHRINIIACHTNLDVTAGGVSDILARRLGIPAGIPMQVTGQNPPVTNHNVCPVTGNGVPQDAVPSERLLGFGRYGRLPDPVPAELFLRRLARILDREILQVVGPLPKAIHTVAVCGGSGSDLVRRAAELGADIYISSEIKHADARWAESRDFCVVDAGHFHSENPVVAELAAALKDRLAAVGFSVPVKISRTQNSPFKVYHYSPADPAASLAE